MLAALERGTASVDGLIDNDEKVAPSKKTYHIQK